MLEFMRNMRAQGVVIDRATLVVLAGEVLKTTRPLDVVPPLTHNWVRSFRFVVLPGVKLLLLHPPGADTT